jgi:hypothetical protein
VTINNQKYSLCSELTPSQQNFPILRALWGFIYLVLKYLYIGLFGEVIAFVPLFMTKNLSRDWLISVFVASWFFYYFLNGYWATLPTFISFFTFLITHLINFIIVGLIGGVINFLLFPFLREPKNNSSFKSLLDDLFGPALSQLNGLFLGCLLYFGYFVIYILLGRFLGLR